MAKGRKSEIQLEGLPERVLADATNVNELAQSRDEMVVLTVKVTAQTRQRVHEWAEKLGWTRGRIVHDAMEMFEERTESLIRWKDAHESR